MKFKDKDKDHLKGIVGFGSQVSIFAAPCGMLISMLA
jgi:hypothetical protein